MRSRGCWLAVDLRDLARIPDHGQTGTNAPGLVPINSLLMSLRRASEELTLVPRHNPSGAGEEAGSQICFS